MTPKGKRLIAVTNIVSASCVSFCQQSFCGAVWSCVERCWTVLDYGVFVIPSNARHSFNKACLRLG